MYPPRSSHKALPVEKHHALGIGDGFLRLSVGIEGADDMIADLTQALRAGASA